MAPTKEWNRSSVLPSAYRQRSVSRPFFGEEARLLDSLLSHYDPPALEELMKVSPELARLTEKALRERLGGTALTKPAFLSYAGTAFRALDPATLEGDSLDYSQEHIRIVSGLYGLLRPLDGISPYRLEMNTPLSVPGEGRLKAFWKKRLVRAISGESPVINLASAEFAEAVDRKALGRRMITLHFKEKSPGGLRTVGMYAKQARGLMVREIIDRRLGDPEELRRISFGGYAYLPGESGPDDWIYAR